MTNTERQAILQLHGRNGLQDIEYLAAAINMEEVSLPAITAIVSAEEGLTLKDLRQKTRKANIVLTRYVIYNIALDFLQGKNKLSTTMIAEFFHQDHSTVFYARKLFNENIHPQLIEKYYLYAKRIKKPELAGESEVHSNKG